MRQKSAITEVWDESPFAHRGVGRCAEVQVTHDPAYRVSAILGPDGNPLLVGYERPKVGFDLTPRNKRT